MGFWYCIKEDGKSIGSWQSKDQMGSRIYRWFFGRNSFSIYKKRRIYIADRFSGKRNNHADEKSVFRLYCAFFVLFKAAILFGKYSFSCSIGRGRRICCFSGTFVERFFLWSCSFSTFGALWTQRHFIVLGGFFPSGTVFGPGFLYAGAMVRKEWEGASCFENFISCHNRLLVGKLC